jgi:hypothetical protein
MIYLSLTMDSQGLYWIIESCGILRELRTSQTLLNQAQSNYG